MRLFWQRSSGSNHKVAQQASTPDVSATPSPDEHTLRVNGGFFETHQPEPADEAAEGTVHSFDSILLGIAKLVGQNKFADAVRELLSIECENAETEDREKVQAFITVLREALIKKTGYDDLVRQLDARLQLSTATAGVNGAILTP